MTKAPHRAIAERASQRPPAIFVADALGLDFLNSVATPVDTEIDWIDDGVGLLAWLEQAQLVPSEVLETLRAQAMPGEFDNVAARIYVNWTHPVKQYMDDYGFLRSAIVWRLAYHLASESADGMIDVALRLLAHRAE